MFFSFPTRDRRLLERRILPWFASRVEFARVLFVGCGWYTRGYERLFAGRQYWTLDNDPAKRRWGARRHITDSIADLTKHFTPQTLDLIVCNGVFGWGLDDRAEVEAAFGACHASLRANGVLLVGWNDVPAHRPFPLQECRSLQHFARWQFPPAEAVWMDAGGRNNHRYEFFIVEADRTPSVDLTVSEERQGSAAVAWALRD